MNLNACALLPLFFSSFFFIIFSIKKFWVCLIVSCIFSGIVRYSQAFSTRHMTTASNSHGSTSACYI